MPVPVQSSRNAPPSPVQTAMPLSAQQSLKRRRRNDQWFDRKARDTSIVDQAAIDAALAQCFDSANDVLSCYPNSSTVVAQHEWATFVWNSRLPQWAQTNAVNLYLFQADTGDPVVNFTNVPNPTSTAGEKHVQIDDRWFGSRGTDWNGENVSFPFFWMITRNDTTIANSDRPQATFIALQTTFADSVIASMSSASASSASEASRTASLSTALSANPTGASSSVSGTGPNGTTPTGGSGNGNGGLQSDSGSSSFPKWAIAVIVVLGFLALVASGILAFFMMRRIRRRREGTLSHRNSMGSSTPMMANADRGPQSPVLGSSVLAAGAGAGAMAAYRERPPSGEGHDAASMTSRTSDTGPFSGADAAIMAHAFRQALRKPDFADRPVEEGESPGDHPAGPTRAELLSQELAEEGRDIRSVGSSRGVRVETLSSDDGNDTATVQDHHY